MGRSAALPATEGQRCSSRVKASRRGTNGTGVKSMDVTRKAHHTFILSIALLLVLGFHAAHGWKPPGPPKPHSEVQALLRQTVLGGWERHLYQLRGRMNSQQP